MKNVIFCAVYKTKEVVGRFYNLPEKMNYLILSRILWRRLVPLLLTLSRFHILLWYFLCWFWKKNAGWPQITFTGICIYFKMSWTFYMLLFHKFGSNHMLNGYTADSRLFEPALARTSLLFKPFFIPRGYSLTSSTKNPSVIRTFSCSNFRLFEPISEPPWPIKLSVIRIFSFLKFFFFKFLADIP